MPPALFRVLPRRYALADTRLPPHVETGRTMTAVSEGGRVVCPSEVYQTVPAARKANAPTRQQENAGPLARRRATVFRPSQGRKSAALYRFEPHPASVSSSGWSHLGHLRWRRKRRRCEEEFLTGLLPNQGPARGHFVSE